MTDAQIQRKLNQLTKIANELVEEATARYGPDGQLFFEAEGGFHLMDGDSMDAHRQEHVRFESRGICHMGAGAW